MSDDDPLIATPGGVPQISFLPPFLAGKPPRRWNFSGMGGQAWFPSALDYLRLRLLAEGRELTLYEDWRKKALSLKGKGS